MSITPAQPAVRELVPLLVVQNIRDSVAFYRDRLGFTMTASWEPDGRLAWCRLQRDGVAVMLQQAEDEDGPTEGRGRGIGLFFICADADVLYAEFLDRGLTLKEPQVAFYGMKQIFLRDPDGYELCFENPTGEPRSAPSCG